MGLAVLLLPLLPGLIDTVVRLVEAARTDPDTSTEQQAALDALAASLDETATAVRAVGWSGR